MVGSYAGRHHELGVTVHTLGFYSLVVHDLVNQFCRRRTLYLLLLRVACAYSAALTLAALDESLKLSASEQDSHRREIENSSRATTHPGCLLREAVFASTGWSAGLLAAALCLPKLQSL